MLIVHKNYIAATTSPEITTATVTEVQKFSTHVRNQTDENNTKFITTVFQNRLPLCQAFITTTEVITFELYENKYLLKLFP